MRQLLFISFFLYSFLSITAIGTGNLTVFYEQKPEDGDITSCVSEVIQDIVTNDFFERDVVLLNVNHNVKISKLHETNSSFFSQTFAGNRLKRVNRLYVTTVHDVAEFQNGMNITMKDSYFNPFANFIIVLEKFEENQHEDMVKFLVYANIYNVSIIVKDGADAGKIYSFKSPIHACNHHQRLVLVSTCSKYTTSPSKPSIFPDMASIRGCKFQLMTYNIFPLVNLDEPNNEGVQQRLLRFFQKYAGIEIKLIPYSKTDKLGRLMGNFTYTDVLEKVLSGEAEGAVGGYFVDFASVYRFSFSYPLMIGHLLVIMPRAAFEDTWHGFFESKARYVHVMVFICFLCFSIAAYSLSLFPSHNTDLIRDLLIVFGYLLNKVTVRKMKSGIPASIILGVFLFFILIIPYNLQSYIWSMKTNPVRRYEPKDFDEIQEHRQLIVTPVWVKEGLTRDRIECESIIECLKRVRDKKDKSYYTLVTDETYETFKWMLADKECNLQLYKLKEPVGILMRAIYFRRGSVLLIPFNEFLFKIMSAGLVDQHYEEISYTEHLKCKPQFSPTTAPLNQSDFKFAYTLLIIGSCISIIVFTFEIVAKIPIMKS